MLFQLYECYTKGISHSFQHLQSFIANQKSRMLQGIVKYFKYDAFMVYDLSSWKFKKLKGGLNNFKLIYFLCIWTVSISSRGHSIHTLHLDRGKCFSSPLFFSSYWVSHLKFWYSVTSTFFCHFHVSCFSELVNCMLPPFKQPFCT